MSPADPECGGEMKRQRRVGKGAKTGKDRQRQQASAHVDMVRTEAARGVQEEAWQKKKRWKEGEQRQAREGYGSPGGGH